jgi:hypothetical protein
MKGIVGCVIDQYDDFSGEVIVSRLSRPEYVPDFIKTAHRLTEQEIDRLPDDGFALVLLDTGRKMKKFAMVDAGNTALSVMYLLERGHLLPPEAVKLAASNLVNACEYYGLSVPEQLKMAARTGFSDVSGRSQTPYARSAKVLKMQFDPSGHSSGSGYAENNQLGKKEEDEDLNSRTNFDSPQGTNFPKIPVFSQKEKTKDDHAGEMTEKTAGVFGDAPGEVRYKEKHWREVSYVDVTGWQPKLASVDTIKKASRTLLRGHYPVDTYDQVKKASEYFIENKNDFSPRDRHAYCVKLASRMSELGMETPDEIDRYGSTTYSAEVEDLVRSRASLVEEEFKPHLDLLLEKRASTTPDTFAEALHDFDQMTGLHFHYGSHVVDPWYTTFGPSREVLASVDWVWDHMGTRVRESDLKALALNGRSLVQESFGAKFADEFQKSPKTFFESLPKPNQLVLARMATDPHAGTISE